MTVTTSMKPRLFSPLFIIESIKPTGANRARFPNKLRTLTASLSSEPTSELAPISSLNIVLKGIRLILRSLSLRTVRSIYSLPVIPSIPNSMVGNKVTEHNATRYATRANPYIQFFSLILLFLKRKRTKKRKLNVMMNHRINSFTCSMITVIHQLSINNHYFGVISLNIFRIYPFAM